MTLFPSIGHWYRDEHEGQTFEVVAIDDKEGTIEVQYNDGNISEFDTETWLLTPVSPAAAPEDANAAYEEGTEEDWHSDSSTVCMYTNPLELIEADNIFSYDAY